MWHTPSSGSEVSVRFYGRQISTLLDFYPMGQSQGPGVSRRCDYTNGFSCLSACCMTATAGSDVVQSGRPIFDDFFQHLWPYIGNNTANVVFQMVKRLWLIRIDQ
ncbi:hypothetical protein TNCV_876203 [Trichonephila clavipes]|nr:hypothetical protein TNCV_876203 [Trichonephila clavipes]